MHFSMEISEDCKALHRVIPDGGPDSKPPGWLPDCANQAHPPSLFDRSSAGVEVFESASGRLRFGWVERWED